MTDDPRTTAVDRIARVLFIRHYVNRNDASEEWATDYWNECAKAAHKGDCPYAEHKGPITCDRCVCDEFRADATAALSGIDLVAVPREPTKAMLDAACQAMRRRQDQLGEDWFPVSNKIKARLRWEAMLEAWEQEIASQ